MHMKLVLPQGTARVNFLVMAIQANCQEDPDIDYDLLNTVQAVLPTGKQISPFREPLRSGDDVAV